MNIAISLKEKDVKKKKGHISFFITFILLIIFVSFFHIHITHSSYAYGRSYDSNIDINVFPPKAIKLIKDNEVEILVTHSLNVGDFILEYDIELNGDEKIEPSLDTSIDFVNEVVIHSPINVIEEVVIDIPYAVITVEDDGLEYNVTEIEQEGVKGAKKEVYKKTYLDNNLISKNLHLAEIVEEPINKIIRLGTKRTAMGSRNCPHWFSAIDNITSNENERDILKFLIYCESKCNDGVNNSNLYFGLLQFNSHTFAHYSNNGDIWNGETQIRTALEMIRAGGFNHHWPHCAGQYKQ